MSFRAEGPTKARRMPFDATPLEDFDTTLLIKIRKLRCATSLVAASAFTVE